MQGTFVLLIDELKNSLMQIPFYMGILNNDVWLLIIGEWWG